MYNISAVIVVEGDTAVEDTVSASLEMVLEIVIAYLPPYELTYLSVI